ncbi:response regulator [Kineosphaera limosa]|uniref:response regulator n=1 Tax=Kineosphaera limosa TaxID=111564 RepID=UPI0005906113
MASLRVVLAEDSALFREGVRALLDSHPAIADVREAASLPQVLELIGADAPDVVITDIRMPPNHRDEGIQLAAMLRDTHPSVGVVVLSQYADAELAVALMNAGSGGRGYLLKERVSDVEHLVAALFDVVAGGSAIDSEIIDELMGRDGRTASSPLERLTPRESEVLALIATGASNNAIAKTLVVTPRAVEKHINSIFAKLDLPVGDDTHRRVAAVLLHLSGGAGTMSA